MVGEVEQTAPNVLLNESRKNRAFLQRFLKASSDFSRSPPFPDFIKARNELLKLSAIYLCIRCVHVHKHSHFPLQVCASRVEKAGLCTLRLHAHSRRLFQPTLVVNSIYVCVCVCLCVCMCICSSDLVLTQSIIPSLAALTLKAFVRTWLSILLFKMSSKILSLK